MVNVDIMSEPLSLFVTESSYIHFVTFRRDVIAESERRTDVRDSNAISDDKTFAVARLGSHTAKTAQCAGQ